MLGYSTLLLAAATTALAKSSSGPQILLTDSPASKLDPKIFGQLGAWTPWSSQEGRYQISSELPSECEVDQVSLIMRHGYRGPSSGVNRGLNHIVGLFSNASTPYTTTSDLEFLQTFAEDFVPLTPELLLPWGSQESFDAGVKFGRRYKHLVGDGRKNWYANFTGLPKIPMRSEDQQRMNQTARFFTRGLLGEDWESRSTSLIVPDSLPTFNTTLAVGTCTNSANDTSSSLAFGTWNNIYLPPIVKRLSKKIKFEGNVTLALSDVQEMQNMCSFHTFSTGVVSPFCGIFTEDEWKSYSYGQDLQSYATAGYGGPLGRAWSVGLVNELIARLTNSPVTDNTTTNTTLNADPATFPLDRKVYLDFSHDTQLSSTISVMGLLRDTPALTATKRGSDSRLWQTSAIVPMGSRIFAERIQCGKQSNTSTRANTLSGTFVRIVLNEAVVPLSDLPECSKKLQGSTAAKAGFCSLASFVESQAFAQAGGDWENCVKQL